MSAFRTVFSLILAVGFTEGYPNGAPGSVCESMTPGHGTQNTNTNPYSITMVKVGQQTYTPGHPVEIQISGTGVIKGALIQARKDGTTTIIGSFDDPAAASEGRLQLLSCSNGGNAITHKDANSKTISPGTKLMWNPPPQDEGDILFVATLAQEKTVWWKDIRSAVLKYSATPSNTSTAEPSSEPVSMAEPVSTAEPESTDGPTNGSTRWSTGTVTGMICLMLAGLREML